MAYRLAYNPVTPGLIYIDVNDGSGQLIPYERGKVLAVFDNANQKMELRYTHTDRECIVPSIGYASYQYSTSLTQPFTPFTTYANLIAFIYTYVQNLGGNPQILTSKSTLTPDLTMGSAYMDGDVVGGVLSFNVMKGNISGLLKSLVLADMSRNTATYLLYLFSNNPTGTYNDQSAPVFNNTDWSHLLTAIHIQQTDYVDNGTIAVISRDVDIQSADAAHIYGVLLTDGATPTYGIGNFFSISIGVRLN